MKVPNAKRVEDRVYNAGVDARVAELPKVAPGGLGPVRRDWWFAGWNDADIALNAAPAKSEGL